MSIFSLQASSRNFSLIMKTGSQIYSIVSHLMAQQSFLYFLCEFLKYTLQTYFKGSYKTYSGYFLETASFIPLSSNKPILKWWCYSSANVAFEMWARFMTHKLYNLRWMCPRYNRAVSISWVVEQSRLLSVQQQRDRIFLWLVTLYHICSGSR